MASSSDAIADLSHLTVETTRRRSVSPTFLRALGLMKVTTKETTVMSVPLARKEKKKKKKKSVPLSKSRGTKTDKNVGGSHTSTSKELIRPHKERSHSKSVAERGTTEETFVVKEEHVSKSKDRARKRSRATSSDKPRNKPVVVVKKTRKPAAPPKKPTDKPTTKKRQHEASPPAMEVPSSAAKSTGKPAENLSESTSAADESIRSHILDSDFKSINFTMLLKNNQFTKEQVEAIQKPLFQHLCRMYYRKPAENLSESTSAADESIWSDILDSDFKSSNFTMLLKNNQFTEGQAEAIQELFQHLCRMYCNRPTKHQRFMKRHECIECHYSISHECASMDSTQYGTVGGYALCIDSIRPEVITMCLCNFTIFHSHEVQQKSKSKRKAESPEPSPLPSPSPLVENNRSVHLDCPRCYMNISITNRNKDPCSDLMNFVSVDGPIRKKFFSYINNHLKFGPKNRPAMAEFYSCRKLCCILFHRCSKEVLVRSSMPIQPHRPTTCCPPSEQT